MKQTKGVDSVGNSFLAGTRSDVSDRIQNKHSFVSQRLLVAAGPLLDGKGERSPFSRGGHTPRLRRFFQKHLPLNQWKKPLRPGVDTHTKSRFSARSK